MNESLNSMNLNVAIIVSDNSILKWQYEALAKVTDIVNVKLVINCNNNYKKRNIFKYFAYYCLNLITLNNRLTVKSELNFNYGKRIDFKAINEGTWQSLPEEVISAIRKEDIFVVIKFGMSLLRIKKSYEDIPILSFHHGDPSHYRGRPAGFYELLFGENYVGIIVQKLSNNVDAGEIYCFVKSKVYPYSYKKTSEKFFSNSKYLLRKAILNYFNNKHIKISLDGTNYKLPSNFIVLKFIIKILLLKMKRIRYGAFIEKKWNIAFLENDSWTLNSEKNLPINSCSIPTILPEYNFYADPMFVPNLKYIRVEALNKITGRGEIIKLDFNLELVAKELIGRHYSYPQTIIFENDEFLFPEVASHSSPTLYKVSAEQFTPINIKGIENERLIDCTLFELNGIYYLFAGKKKNAEGVLYLFFGKGLFEKFEPHPQSPIVIDPSCARMAGPIFKTADKLYRIGQNNNAEYGASAVLFQIVNMTEETYSESFVKEISLNSFKGPHTIMSLGRNTVFDFYEDKFSFFAGYRRFVGKFTRQ